MDGDGARAQIRFEPSAGQDRLKTLGVSDWPIYASGVDDFEHRFTQDETCYVIEGEVTVTPRGGAPLVFRKGDLATFARGTVVRWDMRVPFRKHYRLG